MDIKVGQKFLSNGLEVIVKYTDGRMKDWPVCIEYPDGSVGYFTIDGRHEGDDVGTMLDLQPIPVTITEGVEFSGEQYRAEFERLTKEGREFEWRLFGGKWVKDDSPGCFDGGVIYRLLPQKIAIPENEPFRITSDAMRRECLRLQDEEWREFTCDTGSRSPDLVFDIAAATYTLLPQHRDANGKPLKVGDRVEHFLERVTIKCFDGQRAVTEDGVAMLPSDCRKLTKRTRPLRADDLDKAPNPMFRSGDLREPSRWSENYVHLKHSTLSFSNLGNVKWRPSADQPWQPCEVTEEVPA